MAALRSRTSHAAAFGLAWGAVACSLFAPGEGDLSGGQGASGAAASGGTGGRNAGHASGGLAGAAGHAGTASGGNGGAAGSTGVPCECELDHAQTACVDDTCSIERCLAGWTNANRTTSDGCEAPDVPERELQLWLSTDANLQLGEGDHVARWGDRSPNNFAAAPPSAEASPTRVDGPAGSPLLEFDGNDELVLPAFPAFSELSFFGVVLPLEQPNCPSILHFSNRGERPPDDVEIGRHEGSFYYEVYTEALDDPNEFPVSQLQTTSVIHQPDGTATLYLDGNRVAERVIALPVRRTRVSNFIGNNHWNAATDGGCAPFRGRIGELLFYNRALDAAERMRVEAYLQSKWQLTLP